MGKCICGTARRRDGSCSNEACHCFRASRRGFNLTATGRSLKNTHRDLVLVAASELKKPRMANPAREPERANTKKQEVKKE